SRDEALVWLTQLEAATQPVAACPGGSARR
ncbi:zinc/iron-chelating domain-containing protein, partial [Burkholderia multivorans]